MIRLVIGTTTRVRRRSRVIFSCAMLAFMLPAVTTTALAQSCPPGAHEVGRTVVDTQEGKTVKLKCACDDGFVLKEGRCVRREYAPGPPNFRQSGRGLVGGTTWEFRTYAYNVPPNVSAEQAMEIRSKADRELDRQFQLSGRSKEGFVETDHYHFIVGVATSSNFGIDLVQRVIWDQLTRGRATPLLQEDYNKLRHRAFTQLDCHSNGAMVCLAALANGDATAGRVRLLGPQITRAALKEWENLVKTRRIQSLEIHFNDKDPIAALSYLDGFLVPSKDDPLLIQAGRRIVSDVLFGQGLQDTLRREAPSATIVRFKCGYTGALHFTMDCHKSGVYDAHLNR